MAFYHSNKMPWARPKYLQMNRKISIMKTKKYDKIRLFG